jgi:hypothetical protein
LLLIEAATTNGLPRARLILVQTAPTTSNRRSRVYRPPPCASRRGPPRGVLVGGSLPVACSSEAASLPRARQRRRHFLALVGDLRALADESLLLASMYPSRRDLHLSARRLQRSPPSGTATPLCLLGGGDLRRLPSAYLAVATSGDSQLRARRQLTPPVLPSRGVRRGNFW